MLLENHFCIFFINKVDEAEERESKRKRERERKRKERKAARDGIGE